MSCRIVWVQGPTILATRKLVGIRRLTDATSVDIEPSDLANQGIEIPDASVSPSTSRVTLSISHASSPSFTLSIVDVYNGG